MGDRSTLPEKAAARVCGEVARGALGPYAPALALLPPAERRRAEVLLAYARTLFDFAAQPGPEGERLAMINRLEFDLESALDGSPPRQPIFVALAAEEERHPWPREALERLARAARKRALSPSSPLPWERGDPSAEVLGAVWGALGLGPENERLAMADRPRRLAALPAPYRRAALYVWLVAQRRSPLLGRAARTLLYLRARWWGR